jgi:hypothetical protein
LAFNRFQKRENSELGFSSRRYIVTKENSGVSRRQFGKLIGVGSVVGPQMMFGAALKEVGSKVVEDYGGPTPALDEIVLFPFDDFSIPFRYRLQTGLVSASNAYKLNTQTVLEKGKPGTPDSFNIQFYGSVKRIGDELRMWYLANAQAGGLRVCYATSKDGFTWEKPNLGLVEFNGNKNNNLVDFDNTNVGACVILYEPEDPNPDRRFKMVFENTPFDVGAAFSPDGLRWKNSPKNPILKHNAIEPGGLAKFNGGYYLNGQGGNLGSKRALVTYLSYDFDDWTDAVAVGLRRDMAPHHQMAGPHAGEQVHLGAALWNRGNVLLGVYGQWHADSNERRFVTIDLGLVVSNDAMHFREPIPDFQLVSAYEIYRPQEVDPLAPVPGPALEAGQAFENIGDKTLFWYSPWHGGFICVASWMRDRMGYFQVVGHDTAKPEQLAIEDTHSLLWNDFKKMVHEPIGAHFISCPLNVSGPDMKIYVNVALTDESYITVELLDEKLKPLPGYSGDDCIRITESGLRQPVSWRNKKSLEKFSHPFRVKANWGGKRPEEAFIYAVYVSSKDQV